MAFPKQIYSAVTLLLLVATCSVCFAQDQHPSHRVIEGMPQDLSALRSQLEFLKKLQQLGQAVPEDMKAPELPFGDQPNPLENLDPDMMQSLQQMMQQLSEQRQQEQQSGNDRPTPNTPSSEQRNLGSNQRKNSSSPPKNVEEQQQQAMESMLQDLSERTGIPVEEMLKQAQEQMDQQARNQDGSRNSSNSLRPQSPNIRPARRPEGSRGRRQPSERNELFPQGGNSASQNQNRSTGRSSDADGKDISELTSDAWKQLGRLTRPPETKRNGVMPEPPVDHDNRPNPILSDQERNQGNNNPNAKTSGNEFQTDEILKEIRESPTGMRDKLRSIMNYAKEQSKAGGSSSPQSENGMNGVQAPPAGIQKALTRALESTAKQMFQEGGDLPSPKQSTSAPSTPRQSTKPKTPSRLRAARNMTKDFFKSLANSPDPVTPETPQMNNSSNDDSAEQRSLSQFPWQPLLALFVGAGIALIALSLFHRKANYSLNTEAIKALPNQVRNREDVIHAFHTIVGRAIAPTDRWWPHRRAADAIVQTTPQVRVVMKSLCSVYESARYLPEEIRLSPQELERARNAVATIKAEVTS